MVSSLFGDTLTLLAFAASSSASCMFRSSFRLVHFDLIAFCLICVGCHSMAQIYSKHCCLIGTLPVSIEPLVEWPNTSSELWECIYANNSMHTLAHWLNAAIRRGRLNMASVSTRALCLVQWSNPSLSFQCATSLNANYNCDSIYFFVDFEHRPLSLQSAWLIGDSLS